MIMKGFLIIVLFLMTCFIMSSCEDNAEKKEIATVITDTVITVTDTSAISGGNVSDDGGSVITARGVC
jgi:hypothetical protein